MSARDHLNPKSAGAVFSREAASFFYATACAFRFLRQPSRPKPPMPVANSGSAAGNGVVVGLSGITFPSANVRLAGSTPVRHPSPPLQTTKFNWSKPPGERAANSTENVPPGTLKRRSPLGLLQG